MNLKGLIYRLRLANYNQLLDIAGRLGKWALLNKLDLMGYPQRDRVSALLKREIAAIAAFPISIAALIGTRRF